MSQEKIWAYFQNEGASSFEAALPRYNHLKVQLRKLTKPNAKILNIGVGSGKLENMLHEAGYRVSALDPDAVSIQKLVVMGIDGQVGMAQNQPFDDEAFDAVVASEVLEHLDDATCKKTLSEIRRVLKPGGVFVGTVPFAENLSDNLTVCPHCGERFHRWGHQQSFDESRLRSLFSVEFEVRRISRQSFVVWGSNPMRLVKSSVKWLLGKMGEQIASPHCYFECRRIN